MTTLVEPAGWTEGADFHYKVYPGEGHGFHGAALADSLARTVAFFGTTVRDAL